LLRNSLDRAKAIARVALDGLAEDAVILDMRPVASFCDFFVICEGRSPLHLDAICDRIAEAMEAEGFRAPRREGGRSSTWVVLDYGDVVVHVFDAKTRAFYDLERLWSDAERVRFRRSPRPPRPAPPPRAGSSDGGAAP
jgi:ribosome-associated protein